VNKSPESGLLWHGHNSKRPYSTASSQHPAGSQSIDIITHTRRIVACWPVGRNCHRTLAFDQSTMPWKQTVPRLKAQTTPQYAHCQHGSCCCNRPLLACLPMLSGRSSHASEIIMVCDGSGKFNKARTCHVHDVIVCRAVVTLQTDTHVLLTHFLSRCRCASRRGGSCGT
jgi:hypothetical protein